MDTEKKSYKNINEVIEVTFGKESEKTKKIRKGVEELSLARYLSLVRMSAEKSESEVAQAMGVEEEYVENLENSYDSDITARDLLEFANACNLKMAIEFFKPLNISQEIDLRIWHLKKLFHDLSKMCGDDEDMVAGELGKLIQVLTGTLELAHPTIEKCREIAAKKMPEAVCDQKLDVYYPEKMSEDKEENKNSNSVVGNNS